MTVYRISNVNGKFDHIQGKRAAIARIREIEGVEALTEADAIRDFGWTIARCTPAEARAAGLSA